WIGGGDAKLAAATVLWLGFAHLADYLVYASLFGGALTVALISFAPCRSRRCSPAGSGLSGCTAAAVAFPTVWRSRRRPFSSIRRPSGWRPAAFSTESPRDGRSPTKPQVHLGVRLGLGDETAGAGRNRSPCLPKIRENSLNKRKVFASTISRRYRGELTSC